MFKGIPWNAVFQKKNLKDKIYNNVDVRKFYEIAVDQMYYYDKLCNSSGVHQLTKDDIIKYRKCVIDSPDEIFNEKEDWKNLFNYIEQNYDKLEQQRINLKASKMI